MRVEVTKKHIVVGFGDEDRRLARDERLLLHILCGIRSQGCHAHDCEERRRRTRDIVERLARLSIASKFFVFFRVDVIQNSGG